MTRFDDIPTPACLVDRRVLERNLDRMAERARTLGVSLRPHVKTHKCVEVARLQQERGARGFTVSTLPEAAALFAAGFDDLTWAFPLSPAKIAPALDLSSAGTLRLLVDDAATFDALERAAGKRGARPRVYFLADLKRRQRLHRNAALSAFQPPDKGLGNPSVQARASCEEQDRKTPHAFSTRCSSL